MKRAIVLDQKDIVKIIAEKYGVSEKDVLKSQYSYTVILAEESEEDADESDDGELEQRNL